MIVCLAIITTLQFVATVMALLCESRDDPRFEGDKLIYRS